jgi:hypothetical protein
MRLNVASDPLHAPLPDGGDRRMCYLSMMNAAALLTRIAPELGKWAVSL